MRRVLATAALILCSLHVLVLWSVGASDAGIFWSNTLQLFISLVATFAYFHFGRSARGPVRWFCWLSASSFALWSIAQVGWLYYESYAHAAVPVLSLPNTLFAFSATPIAVAIFLPNRLKEEKWSFFLDCLQIVIVLLGAYLFFFRFPSSWINREATEWRDWFLIVGLLLRCAITPPGTLRQLFAGMAVVFVVYAAGDKLWFPFTSPAVISAGKWWLDLAWSASFALATLFVTTTAFEEHSEVPSSLTPNAGFYVIPALIPMMVLISAARIARSQLLLAAAAVLLSFGIYGLRLFLMQLQAQRLSEELRKSEERFRALAAGTSSGTGEALFRALARQTSEATGATYTLLGELRPNSANTIRTLAALKHGEIIPNFEYDLQHTPCENVLGKQLCHYPSGVARSFPQDQLLREMGVDAYMGTPLFASSGEPLGLFAILGERPFRNPDLAKSFLQICASRAATELERLRAEEALRVSEETFSLAFKQSPNVVILGRVEGKHYIRVAEVNDAAVEFYGSRETLIGKTGIELNVWADSRDREEFWKELRDHGKVTDREMSLRRKSGEERTLLVSADLFRVRGEPWLLLTGHDITFERAAREALFVSEAKYRDLFENANDFIFTANTAGNFISINKTVQKLCALSLVEALSSKVTDILTPESATEYQQRVSLLLRTLQPTTCEVTLGRRVAGAPILELALRPILENGMVMAVQGIGRNIMERRMLEKKFLQSQRMEAVGTLAAGIAHDFNNLLTVITGYAQLAKEKVEQGGSLSGDLEEIQQASRRAASLTNQLLSFTRKQVSQRVATSLNESVKGMEKMLKRVIGEDVELETKLDPATAPIWSDPTQIDQIIMNLAANARDAMPSGGTIRFVTSNLKLDTYNERLNLKQGDYAVLMIEDTGVGMDQATMSRIFEPFFTTKAVGKGTGLGLATAYGIVQQAGGQIAVASEPGRGTIFTLYFPTTDRQGTNHSGVQIEASVRGSETILLVEDDSALRSLAARILESAGYTVYSASGVEQAERMLGEIGGQIDLVVTDVVMPDGGGSSLVSRVASSRPGTKMLFMSGYTDGKVPEEYLIGDHPSFLAKPFHPAQLAKKVREVLDSKQTLVATRKV